MGAAEGDWVGRIDYLTDAAPINRERNIRVFVAERLLSLFISVFVFLLRNKSIRASGAQSAGSDCPQCAVSAAIVIDHRGAKLRRFTYGLTANCSQHVENSPYQCGNREHGTHRDPSRNWSVSAL
jgi:hypothetical protein